MLSTKLTVCLGLLLVINIEAAPAPKPWHLPNLPPLSPPQPPMYPPQPPMYPPQPPMYPPQPPFYPPQPPIYPPQPPIYPPQPPIYPPQPPFYPPQPPMYPPQPPMCSIFNLFDDLFKPWGMSSSGNQGGYPWTMLNRAESGQWDDQIIEECNPS